ncbi:MAG TPA: FGGY family carbohydrate kinase [Roseiarcus sp.]|nr:FGGY family carbohydrate kinase [Roseiarcus sp.]
MKGCVAVFDLGKSNIKLFVFDVAGVVLAEHSEGNAPLAPDAHGPYPQLDTERAWAFLLAALKDVGRRRPIEAISTTTHGSAGALLENEALALPPMDYEFGEFGWIDPEYEKARPPYAETLSPSLPRGHNLGRQLFYMQRRFPDEFACATTFLAYPQYWAWRLSGVAASEATSLGSHTDLWNPGEGRLSSMVDRLGWRRLFPPLRKAWDTLGSLRPEVVAATGLKPDVRVICGAHDSNASLVPYLASRRDPFTVISTGTWIIIMAVGGKGRLDPEADMLANVDVRGLPTPTARFMGGRQFAALAGEEPAMVSEADVAAIVAAGVIAVPAFSEQGGPFGGRRKGVVEGSAATASGRAALATLYCALMTAHLVERLEAQGDLIVEGGFNRTPAFAGVLAALLQGRAVFAAPTAGAAAGAAMLAHWGEEKEPPRLEAVRGWPIPGLAEYRKRWERRL